MRTQGILGLIAVIYLTFFTAGDLEAQQSGQANSGGLAAAHAFTPSCDPLDELCAAWKEFRNRRPYPLQTIAAKHLGNGELAMVISEPSPNLTNDEWEALVKATFGDDLLAIQRSRWMIGIDGWVEDLVLKVRQPDIAVGEGGEAIDDLFHDALLRDRIALLHLAMYGSTFGARVESMEAPPAQVIRGEAPNLQPTAKELHDWLTDASISWWPLDPEGSPPTHWLNGTKRVDRAALVSEDGTLVMLVFPVEDLSAARSGEALPDELRTAFRQFAVSSDAVIGGAWTRGGQVAVLARARFVSPDIVPPLRFETFALLAAEGTDELNQSYERTNILAGKMLRGDYPIKDWAPIYLSEPLLDTELGALMNITDQMLKSWSQKGIIEYIHFAYPHKPEHFPFGDQPLSELVYEDTGSTRVLFNWNTAGSAVVVEMPPLSVLTTRQTGALPVTYGSDLEPGGNLETGHLRKYEDTAYDYFAGLKDQNLARVVQYTLLYQLFRAVTADTEGHTSSAGSRSAGNDEDIPQRAKATELLVVETKKLVAMIDEDAQDTILLEDAKNALEEFRAEHRGVDDARLARLLADPRSEQQAMARQALKLENTANEYLVGMKEIDQRIDEYNADLVKYQATADAFNTEVRNINALGSAGEITVWAMMAKQSRLELWSDKIERDGQEIVRIKAKYEKMGSPFEDMMEHQKVIADVGQVRRSIKQVAFIVRDLDQVRTSYIERNSALPSGWVKTPSVVLSWNTGGLGSALLSTGGHNLGARTLRMEQTRDVTGIELVETESGLVLRYNPARADEITANATRISRAVEHGGMRSVDELRPILARSVPQRTRSDALEIPAGEGDAAKDLSARIARWRGELGAKPFTEKVDFVDDLRTIARENDCCLFVARDNTGRAHLTRRNPAPPPTVLVTRFGDTPSLTRKLAKLAAPPSGKPVVMLGTSTAHAEAIARSMGRSPVDKGALMKIAHALRGGKRQSRNADDVHFTHYGILGEPVSLRTSSGRYKGAELLSKTTESFESRPIWEGVQVRKLEKQEIESMLPSRWNEGHDGMPTAVIVSFKGGGTGRMPDNLTVFGGVERTQVGQAGKHIAAVSEELVSSSKTDGATLGQFMMSLKSRLENLSDLRFRRLLMVVDEKEDRIFYSRNDLVKANRSDS